MKPAGAMVILHYRWWYGQELPAPGDHLVTSTGRRYLILGVEGKRLDCLVVDRDARPDPGQMEFRWSWAVRRRTK